MLRGNIADKGFRGSGDAQNDFQRLDWTCAMRRCVFFCMLLVIKSWTAFVRLYRGSEFRQIARKLLCSIENSVTLGGIGTVRVQASVPLPNGISRIVERHAQQASFIRDSNFCQSLCLDTLGHKWCSNYLILMHVGMWTMSRVSISLKNWRCPVNCLKAKVRSKQLSCVRPRRNAGLASFSTRSPYTDANIASLRPRRFISSFLEAGGGH